MDRDDDSRRIEQAAAEWLARRDTDAWTEQDQRALQAWLDAKTTHRVAFLRLESAWREAGRMQALAAGWPKGVLPPRGYWAVRTTDPLQSEAPRDDETPSLAPPDLRGLSFAPRKQDKASRWGRVAAAAVALVTLGSLGWGSWQLSGRQQASYASGIGEVKSVAMADGSTATLSSDSQLQVLMTRGERHIALVRGEAFFDVAHDAGRPFIVEAEHRQVRAVGTRFSVRRDADALRVVVTQGKVRLDSAPGAAGHGQPAAFLPAGSVATAGRDGVLVRSLSLAEAERFLEWRSGYLSFDDAPLSAVAAEFNRFNVRKLELADPAVADLRVGGNFRWDNANGFAGLLEQGFPVRVERRPDRIVLHAR